MILWLELNNLMLIYIMKFDKLHSHNSTPKTVEFTSTTKSTFVPPPLGLEIVTMPNNKIFDLFLKGSISAK